MNYSTAELYRGNKNVFLEGIQDWWVDQLCRKALRLAARLFPRRVRPVFGERLIEYPLLFQNLSLEAPGSHLLDFGSVEDLLPIHLCALGYRVTGLDFRPYPFRHERFDFIQADILTWQPPEGLFDAAISISTVEHVGLGTYGDPARSDGDKIAVGKLMKAIRSGGYLFLTVPAGSARTTLKMRVYDPAGLHDLIPSTKEIRYFAKSGRYGDWNEVAADAIANLTYEHYGATIGNVEGFAFIVARKE